MSRRCYPAYKSAGVEWLDAIPEGWEMQKLRRICPLTTGWTPPSGDDALYLGDNPWANISDLGPRVLAAPQRCISDEAVRTSRIPISPKGSLLFSFKLSIGQVSFAGQDMYTNEAIATFRESDHLDLGFAYYSLPFALIKNANENIYGAKLLNQELMYSARIPLPPVSQQRAIAEFLDRETAKIDALIAKQQQLIATLREDRAATITHAVTKGLNPEVSLTYSGVNWIGQTVADWRIVPVRVAMHESDVRNTGGLNENYLSLMANIGVIPYGEKGDVGNKKPEDLSKCKIVRPNDFVINSMNYQIGSYGVSAYEGVCSPVYIVIQHRPEIVHLRFALRIFEVPAFQRYAQSFGNGILDHRRSISWNTLKNLRIPLPPKTEQQEILDFLDLRCRQIGELIATANKMIKVLTEYRTTLITDAVTGKIDVRGVA